MKYTLFTLDIHFATLIKFFMGILNVISVLSLSENNFNHSFICRINRKERKVFCQRFNLYVKDKSVSNICFYLLLTSLLIAYFIDFSEVTS